MKKNLKRLSCFILILVLNISTLCTGGVSIYSFDLVNTHPALLALMFMGDEEEENRRFADFKARHKLEGPATEREDLCNTFISCALEDNFRDRERNYILPLATHLFGKDVADSLGEYLKNLHHVHGDFIDDLFSEEAMNFILNNYRSLVDSKHCFTVPFFGMLRKEYYNDTLAWLQSQGL